MTPEPLDGLLRVLLVEDSATDAELVLLELEKGGFAPEALRIETAEEMIAALADRAWDLVLSDFQLPAFGGLEALRILQLSELDVPFILLSGAIGEEIAVACMKAGAHDYVLKDRLGRLCPVVERELREATSRRKRRQAEEALLASEARYRDLFEHSPVPMAVENLSQVKPILDGYRAAGIHDLRAYFLVHREELERCTAAVVIKDLNQACLAFFGVKHREDLPLELGSYFTEERWQSFAEELATYAEGGTIYRGECAIQDLQGRRRVIAMHASVSPGFEQTLGRILFSFTDVTQKAEMEARIRESESRLRLAATATGFGVYAHDFASRGSYFSREFLELHGVAAEDPASVREGDVYRAVHAEDRARLQAAMTEANDPEGPGILELEYRVLLPDGAVRWLKVKGRTLFEGHQPARGNGIVQDITARRTAEEELEHFFSLIPDLACVVSADGFFRKLNPVWETTLGFTMEELMARPGADFIHPDDLQSTMTETALQHDGHSPSRFVNRYRCRDGSYRWLEWNASPYVEGRTFGVARDITERRSMEAMLKDLERLSAKGQMAAYIAHEINNPLAGIKNAFALVERAVPPDHPHMRYAGLIKREIDRIASIIRTMYHVYRPPSREVRPISLREAFQDIEGLLEAKCRSRGLCILMAMEDPGARVVMNDGLLRQVLFNLVLNAIDASPDDGEITLRSSHHGSWQLIAVEDQGPGIPPEVAEHIFRPGFTTKGDSSMSGLGLGLATCRNILESHGGRLSFRARSEGRGTVFEAAIPDAPDPSMRG